MADRGPEYQFELTGGVLCFDFANTVDRRGAPDPIDHLTDYAELVSWLGQSGVVSQRQAGELARAAADQPATANQALRRALDLRETIYNVFSKIAAGRQPSKPELLRLSAYATEAMSQLRLTAAADSFNWTLKNAASSLIAPVAPVAKSAADLLVSANLRMVRECAAQNCGWLFLDRSRNQTRRWCDMNICGNREKVRRYRRTARGAPAPRVSTPDGAHQDRRRG